jgi:hypothetical protein
VAARITRAYCVQNTRINAAMTLPTPAPRTATSASANKIAGKAKKTSTTRMIVLSIPPP